MLAGSSAAPSSRSQAAVPPMPGSSQPGKSAITSQPGSGSRAQRSTRASVAATPEALSLAPGTGLPRATSSWKAIRPASRARPSRRVRRGTASAKPTAGSVAKVPPRAVRTRRGSHISPVWAASWWAISTRVRRRSPAAGTRARTLVASAVGSSRRSHCERPEYSSS